MNKNLLGGLVGLMIGFSAMQADTRSLVTPNFGDLTYNSMVISLLPDFFLFNAVNENARATLKTSKNERGYEIKVDFSHSYTPPLDVEGTIQIGEDLNLVSAYSDGSSLVIPDYRRRLVQDGEGGFHHRKFVIKDTNKDDSKGPNFQWVEDMKAYRNINVSNYTSKWGTSGLERDLDGDVLLIHAATIPYFIPAMKPQLNEGEKMQKSVLMTTSMALYLLELTYSNDDGRDYVSYERKKVGSSLEKKGDEQLKIEIREGKLQGFEIAGRRINLVE